MPQWPSQQILLSCWCVQQAVVPDQAHLDHPVWKGDVTGAIADVSSAGMEAHDRLHLQTMLACLFEQLHVRRKIVLLGSVPLADTPPVE